MSDEKRNYQKRRRGDLEERTRLRIIEATVELHGTLGPSRASISAIARRAGVRRSTVYRHFPDEFALYTACSSHWLAGNPLPDIGRWAAIADPDDRLTVALHALYAYYHRTEHMLANILRDEAAIPILTRTLEGYREYLKTARSVLLAERRVTNRARRKVVAAVGHALAFATWRSFVREQQLDNQEAAALMCRLVAAAGPAEPVGMVDREAGAIKALT